LKKSGPKRGEGPRMLEILAGFTKSFMEGQPDLLEGHGQKLASGKAKVTLHIMKL